MKNSLVTSENGQVQGIVDVVGIAAMNAVKVQAEKFTTAERQRVLAQGDKFTHELKDFIIDKMREFSALVIGYLKLISGGWEIVIGETDGTGTITGAGDVFTGYINPAFVNDKTNVRGKPTKKTRAQVFRMVHDGTLAQIFGGFGENLDCLCFEQDQIKLFVRDHASWLCWDNSGTFFLFKVNGEFFVAYVRRYSRIRVDKYCLSTTDIIWEANNRHRFVVPQL